uniref:ANAPC4_WD40 domain-containing protein n=1 Tax=Parastrongyloides trichosuri TaxID=131310 RepID=A0A0N4ZK31_PARTI
MRDSVYLDNETIKYANDLNCLKNKWKSSLRKHHIKAPLISNVRCASWNCTGEILAIGTNCGELLFINFEKDVETFADMIIKIATISESKERFVEECIYDLKDSDNEVNHIVFHNKHPHMCVSSSSDHSLRFWNPYNAVKVGDWCNLELATQTINSMCFKGNTVTDATLYCITNYEKLWKLQQTSNDFIVLSKTSKNEINDIVVYGEDNCIIGPSHRGTVILYDGDTLEQTHQFEIGTQKRGYRVTALNKDETLLALGNNFAQVQIFLLKEETVLTQYDGMRNTVRHLSFSACGKFLAIGGDDDYIVILETKNFEEIYRIDNLGSKCRFLEFNPIYPYLIYKECDRSKMNPIRKERNVNYDQAILLGPFT